MSTIEASVVGGVVAHKMLETAQSPNSSFPLGLDLGLGLGLVNNLCTLGRR